MPNAKAEQHLRAASRDRPSELNQVLVAHRALPWLETSRHGVNVKRQGRLQEATLLPMVLQQHLRVRQNQSANVNVLLLLSPLPFAREVMSHHICVKELPAQPVRRLLLCQEKTAGARVADRRLEGQRRAATSGSRVREVPMRATAPRARQQLEHHLQEEHTDLLDQGVTSRLKADKPAVEVVVALTGLVLSVAGGRNRSCQRVEVWEAGVFYSGFQTEVTYPASSGHSQSHSTFHSYNQCMCNPVQIFVYFVQDHCLSCV